MFYEEIFVVDIFDTFDPKINFWPVFGPQKGAKGYLLYLH